MQLLHMLRLSKEVDYAIQLLYALKAEKNKPLSLRIFSRETSISYLFLQKIARKLKQVGIIESKKGSMGGYILTHKGKLSLKDVIGAIHPESTHLVSCLNKPGSCSKEGICTKQKEFASMQDQLVQSLSAISIFSYEKPTSIKTA